MDQSNWSLLKRQKLQRKQLILEAIASINKVFKSHHGHLAILTALREIMQQRVNV